MFGFIEREQILLKQNIYDLLHNTRIGKKAFLFLNCNMKLNTL